MKTVQRGQCQFIRLFGRTPARLHQNGSKFTQSSASEMSHFNALASTWWDVNGSQRILHKMNGLRMDFITENLKSHLKLNANSGSELDDVYIPPFNVDLLPPHVRGRIAQDQELRTEQLLQHTRLRVLDVGCGGGILAESMARLAFVQSVKGIDLSRDVLEAANLHREKDPILADKLVYEQTSIEGVPEDEKYDVVTMFEVLEHVDYPARVLEEGLSRLDVGGPRWNTYIGKIH
ncbi:uncharacterized protein LODBEIA_P42370 [Lodderomyces beijingensis]|uniref:Hexaprenyldihydroxybenzoate methyltransferase, mitochondrial n=1 Tax=Lodderomyces beijingensis TaxID=1775926 RepID=A0ABP0ZPC9_9ASCO